jgi:heme-degrading monooxygenase HmoA
MLYDEPEPEAAVSAWTEADSARKWASSAQKQVTSQAEEVHQRRLEPGWVIRKRDQL